MNENTEDRSFAPGLKRVLNAPRVRSHLVPQPSPEQRAAFANLAKKRELLKETVTKSLTGAEADVAPVAAPVVHDSEIAVIDTPTVAVASQKELNKANLLAEIENTQNMVELLRIIGRACDLTVDGDAVMVCIRVKAMADTIRDKALGEQKISIHTYKAARLGSYPDLDEKLAAYDSVVNLANNEMDRRREKVENKALLPPEQVKPESVFVLNPKLDNFLIVGGSVLDMVAGPFDPDTNSILRIYVDGRGDVKAALTPKNTYDSRVITRISKYESSQQLPIEDPNMLSGQDVYLDDGDVIILGEHKLKLVKSGSDWSLEVYASEKIAA